MSQIEFKGIPTFRILEYKKAVQFYVDFLDFKIDWEHRFAPNEPVYMQISKNGLILHLTENQRFKSETIAFVDTKGMMNFHRELSDRNPEIGKVILNSQRSSIKCKLHLGRVDACPGSSLNLTSCISFRRLKYTECTGSC